MRFTRITSVEDALGAQELLDEYSTGVADRFQTDYDVMIDPSAWPLRARTGNCLL
jgi:hypothetical protein